MKRFLVGAVVGFVSFELGYHSYDDKVKKLKQELYINKLEHKRLLEMHNKLQENWDALKNYIPPKEH